MNGNKGKCEYFADTLGDAPATLKVKSIISLKVNPDYKYPKLHFSS